MKASCFLLLRARYNLNTCQYSGVAATYPARFFWNSSLMKELTGFKQRKWYLKSRINLDFGFVYYYNQKKATLVATNNARLDCPLYRAICPFGHPNCKHLGIIAYF